MRTDVLALDVALACLVALDPQPLCPPPPRHRLALVYNELRDWDSSLSLYNVVLSGFSSTLGSTHLQTLEVIGNISVVHQRRGDVDPALSLALRALDGYRAEAGRDSPFTIKAKAAVAEVYSQREEWDEALEWFGEVLEDMDREVVKAKCS